MGTPVHGLSPRRELLANGLVVTAKQTAVLPSVSLNLAIRAGSLFDSSDRVGTALFLSRVIDRGTERRSADDIADDLDGRGVSLRISVTRHLMTLSCTCLVEDFEAMLELLGDVIQRPTCPDEEVEKRRGEILTAIRQDEDNPAAVASERLMANLYGPTHPYGRPPKGTLASVERIGRSDLLAFHRAYFVPSAVSLVVVGDVAESTVVTTASRVFGGWTSGAVEPASLPPVPRSDTRRLTVVPMMSKSQADIAYGFIAIRRNDPAYYAYWMMNIVLGQYGLGGRLGDNIRERQGMAYYVFSSFDANVLEGPLAIRAGVSPTNVDRAIAAIDEEVDRMAAEGLSEQELIDARQYLIGSIPRMLETDSGIATFLQTAEFFGLGLDFDVRLPQLIESVTLEQTRHAARVLGSGRAVVVVAGPYTQTPGQTDATPVAAVTR